MSKLTVILRRAMFGVGTAQHEHAHRHNTLYVENINLDTMRMEQQVSGGVSQKTLNDVAQQSGHITSRPQGWVSLEEGFNHRCGIALLQFEVESNANMVSNMSVVCHLVGGQQLPSGLSGDVRLVPMRCWTTLEEATHDFNGHPMVKHTVDSSHQMLMGDPHGKEDLTAVRPYDIGNTALGVSLAHDAGNPHGYTGSANGSLNTQVLVSKTNNLNPVHHSKELLKMAVKTADESRHDASPSYSLGGCLTTNSIGEISPAENPFMFVMMHTLGVHSLNGFRGWSVDELAEVFENFVDVLNLENLDVNKFAADTTIMDTAGYGTASLHEIIASEIAMSTVHLLLSTGLMSYNFSATNNPSDFDGIQGEDGGVAFSPGPAMSVLENDMNVDIRVERFNGIFVDNFFAKFSGPYAHLRTVMNIEVDAHMFGELSVGISLNGDRFNHKRFSNATYYIAYTSSSIAVSQKGLDEGRNYLSNIRECF